LAKKLLIQVNSFIELFRVQRMGGTEEMTYEKWMEEMTGQLTLELALPSTNEPVIIPDKLKDYCDEDEQEE
jgi:hypothetical protein